MQCGINPAAKLFFSLSIARKNCYIRAMLKALVTVLILLIASSASGEDFILRATSNCCGIDSCFRAGSDALLIDRAKTHAESKLETDSFFLFEKVEAGKYDLAVSAVGYYPEKFLDLDIGKNGVFDFELIATLQPISRSAILEGQIIVRFRPAIPDKEIVKRLGNWDLGALQRERIDDRSKPMQHEIERMHKYAEVRAIYDRSRDITDLIWTALRDPSVIECIPVYFSPRD